MAQEARLLRGQLLAIADRAEFEAQYVATWQRVYRYAWVLTRHRQDAEDVAAETYRRAFSAWTAGRRPKGDILPWLLLIARRVVIDRRRRSRLLGWLPLSAVSDVERSDDRSLERAEIWLWFAELSRVLPDRQREALLLRYQFDLSDEAIGKILGVSPGGVRSLLSRALATLRRRPEMLT
ncbi:MAG TPA: sigma-70 family RNA polymerase sigma factor [Candidatus Limnocylindrales bacterium]